MRFLETNKTRSGWNAAPVANPIHAIQGCVQCGSQLIPGEFGKFSPTGKCPNCAGWISDDDEEFEDFEG
jgi:hypothetical protein